MGDISNMVAEYATFVKENPPNPSLLLEIGNLADLGVDLSFFSDPTQIAPPGGSSSGGPTGSVEAEAGETPVEDVAVVTIGDPVGPETEAGAESTTTKSVGEESTVELTTMEGGENRGDVS